MRAASLARKSSLLKNIGVSDFSICCKMEGRLEMAGTCILARPVKLETFFGTTFSVVNCSPVAGGCNKWSAVDCLAALEKRSEYTATGSVFWVHLDHQHTSLQTVSFLELLRDSRKSFSPSYCVLKRPRPGQMLPLVSDAVRWSGRWAPCGGSLLHWSGSVSPRPQHPRHTRVA